MSAQFSLCHIYCSGITFLASCLVFRCNVATVQPSPATWQTQDVHSVTATLICEFNASESRKNSLLRTSSSKINRPVFSLQTFWLVMVGIFAALTYNKSWFAKCPGKLWRRAGTHSTVTLKQLSVIQPPLIISIHTCAFPTVTCQNVFGTKKKKGKANPVQISQPVKAVQWLIQQQRLRVIAHRCDLLFWRAHCSLTASVLNHHPAATGAYHRVD